MDRRTIRVLSVEDNGGEARLIREILAEACQLGWDLPSFEVEWQATLQEALARLDAGEIDVVLTDLDLPDSRAGETFAKLHRHVPQLPIVVLTGREDEALARQTVREGAEDYLFKREMNGSLLAHALIYAIERKESKQALRAARDELEKRVVERTQALHESEERYALATEAGRIGVWDWNLEEGCIYLDPTINTMLGREAVPTLTSLEEALQLVHPDERQELLEVVQYLAAAGLNHYAGTVKMLHSDGQPRWFSVSGRGFRDAQGKLVRVVGVDKEITESKRAEEALRRSEADLRAVLNSGRQAFILMDRDYRIRVSNAIAQQWTEQLFGKRMQRGDSILDFIREEDRERFEGYYRQALEGEHVVVEEEFRRDEELIYSFTFTLSPVLQNGKTTSVNVSALDITQRKRTEERLIWQAEVDAALAALYKPLTAPAATMEEITTVILAEARRLTTSTHGYVSAIDPQTGENVGHTLTRMLESECAVEGPDCKITFPPGEEGRYPGLWGHSLNTREPFYTNDANAHPTSSGVPQGHVPLDQFLAVPVLLGEELVGQIALANPERDYGPRDLEAILRLAEFYALALQRRRAEEALRQSETRYRMLVENFPNGAVILFDKDLRYLVADGAGLEEVGLSRELLEGKRLEELFTPELCAYLTPFFRATLAGEPQIYEVPYAGRIYENRTFPIRDEEGEVVAGLLMTQDITARKQTEAELARSNTELQQFAYAVSHDLQEPLRTITGFLQLIEEHCEGQMEQETREFLGYVMDAAARMQEMIQALLNLSRVRTRAHPLESTDCENLLAESLFSLQRVIEECDATVTHAPLPQVLADPGQLRQVFQNLIANALKFQSGEEPPHVHVTAGREGEVWRFAVRDNGIGIPADQAGRLFKIFQRLHPDYPGTGIGLALCHRIIERHGGQIWVESEVGQGSTFYFTLPAIAEGD